jgi:hypothetical protein
MAWPFEAAGEQMEDDFVHYPSPPLPSMNGNITIPSSGTRCGTLEEEWNFTSHKFGLLNSLSCGMDEDSELAPSMT